MAEDERSEEERWMDRLLNPMEGPASENAYPEDMMIEIDGKEVPMNSAARTYNRSMGYVDEAAHIPWTPENAKSPEGSEPPGPTEEELAQEKAQEAELDKRFERYEQSKLKSASQLPDLAGEDLEITWDFEEVEGEEDGWTVLRHGDQEIWREVGMKQAMPRFDEVLWILREKYGPRLASLNPTHEGELQLRGLGYSARTFAANLNLELQRKRRPLGSRWAIDDQDDESDTPEPERRKEQLLAAVGEIGSIDCSCGWAGDASDGRTVERESQLELLCPECRRPLFCLIPKE